MQDLSLPVLNICHLISTPNASVTLCELDVHIDNTRRLLSSNIKFATHIKPQEFCFKCVEVLHASRRLNA